MTLFDKKFDNSFAREFPSWPHGAVNQPIQTPGVLFARAKPEPVSQPEILAWSDEVAALLELPNQESFTADFALRQELAAIFVGNKIADAMEPIATRYGGHQFGNWAGQLGDGRAISLGERLNARGQRWEIQLKGAGRTAYSRFADGRAVLRSSLREFICSEAMFHLGIPTTRALCCASTGEQVVRDMFYDGHPRAEPGAITTRVAPSFLRFGHFEILAASREYDHLKKLIQYAIIRHFPGMMDAELTDEVIVKWFQEISNRTATLVTHWLRVGFVHGVLNTDNMSILGLTIDYGPYGWLDVYDPSWTPNTTDFEHRRYRFEQQPSIGLWNLTRFAEALSTVVEDTHALEAVLNSYAPTFQELYRDMRLAKLGLIERHDGDGALVDELDQVLVSTEIDMTIFYRNLADIWHWTHEQAANEEFVIKFFESALYSERPTFDECAKLCAWIARYNRRIEKEAEREQATQRMNVVNPVFVPRNYQVQEVLDDLARNDRGSLDRMMRAMREPYEMNVVTESFFKRRPEWARRRPGCSSLSCSS